MNIYPVFQQDLLNNRVCSNLVFLCIFLNVLTQKSSTHFVCIWYISWLGLKREIDKVLNLETAKTSFGQIFDRVFAL